MKMLREPTDEEYLELTLTDWVQESLYATEQDLGPASSASLKIQDNATGFFAVSVAGNDVLVVVVGEDHKGGFQYNVVNEKFEYELSVSEEVFLKEGKSPVFDVLNIKEWV